MDILLLFDDTGSFASTAPLVQQNFSQLVSNLSVAFPLVNFAFGVGRFEDFGGPATDWSGDFQASRPFILNQAILPASAPGFGADLTTALNNEAPGFGGDGPETAIEALYQVATGAGFDGDDNGSRLDSGAAGAAATQTAPGTSGDVPPFSSYVGSGGTSGIGGVGWRRNACRFVLLATDVCSVAPMENPLPAMISGTGGDEAIAEFACESITAGVERFGFVGDATSEGANTVAGAVAPVGSVTVQQAITALNDLGIRVIGLTNQEENGVVLDMAVVGPVSGPDFSGIAMLQAVARLTGAVDANGDPLVFPITNDVDELQMAIEEAIQTAITSPVNVRVEVLSADPSLGDVTVSPDVVPSIDPGDTAAFSICVNDQHDLGAVLELGFRDQASGALLARARLVYNQTCTPSVDLAQSSTGVSMDPECGGEPLNPPCCCQLTWFPTVDDINDSSIVLQIQSADPSLMPVTVTPPIAMGVTYNQTPAVFDICINSTHAPGAILEVGIIWPAGGPQIIDSIMLVYDGNCVATLQSGDGNGESGFRIECPPPTPRSGGG